MANGETHALAETIAAYIRRRGLTELYGGQVIEARNERTRRKYLSIGFSLLRVLDGEVCVYSPHWIIVKQNGGWEQVDSPEAVFRCLAPWVKSVDVGDQMELPDMGLMPAYPDESDFE